MDSPVVKLHSSSVITPSSPTPRHAMFLATVDIIWRWFHYNQRILFFKLPPDAHSSCVATLKSSLSLALVDFFPWAGRFFEQPDGRLALDCNDAGVEFLEASVDVPFSTLEADGFQHREFFKQLAPMGDVVRWTGPDLPLLSVQVTRFPEDAGIVVGVAQSHGIADGHSFWHFMKSWGERARGLPISMPPLHIRTELGPEKLPIPDAAKFPQGAKLPEPAKPGRTIATGAVLNRPPHGEDLAQRDFHFSADGIRRLKQSASENGQPPSTSFEALIAHVWKHMTAARGVRDETKSQVSVLANFRSRLVPPLPPAYFGNAIFMNAAKAKAGELGSESLAATARRIHEVIVAMDDEYFRRMLGMVEVLDPEAIVGGREEGMVSMNVASSPRFPVYEVEFGWGRPACVRSARIRGNGEIVLFAGAQGGGSIDVSVALSQPTMERLLHDHSFYPVQ